MDFDHILDQAIEMLQRRGRLTYRTLKRQFELDDEALEDLKAELLYSQPQVLDDEGRGLVWTGNPLTSQPDERPEATAGGRLYTLLPVVMWVLQREKRITYCELQHLFSLNDTLMLEIGEELRLRRLAVDEEGKVLVWTGEAPTREQPVTPVANGQETTTSSPVPSAPQPQVAATNAPENIPAEPQISEPEPIRSTPEGERRQLTVMFCDIVGSTDLSGRLDPEDLREVVRAYQETAAQVVERYEGHIAQYLGDGLLIYFGYPVAHEDDVHRAVHTGLDLVEAMGVLNTRLKTDYAVELAVRIGIHTGPVVVGEMGSGERLENLALGETPNIAARLESLAASNTIVISPVTARLVQRSFELENLGPHDLKGVSEPMMIARVIGRIDSEITGVDRQSLIALVGRDEEIGLLLRRWAQAKEGLGQVVLLSGEAGIGKSSLVEGLRSHVRQESLTRLTFRCSPYHTNSALYPIIESVQRILGWEPDDTAEMKQTKLERALEVTHLDRQEAVPLMASLLSLELPENRYPDLTLSPQQQRQQTQDTLVAWLQEEAERQPLLAVWEDLHWADPSTLEVLELVLEQTPTCPMLHLLTYRPEFEPFWTMRSHLTPITLNRLERLQVEAVIDNMARRKALPSEVVEHIVAKTDGVPLYVEELTKMLLESTLLHEEQNHYVLTGPMEAVAIPDTLQDSLMARLDQMNSAKEVAQLGSVLGREFSYEMLQAIASQDNEILQASLAQLVEAELLYQRGRPPQARYIFKHALIQDAAYQSLLRSTRQQIHHQIAQVLDTDFPKTVRTQPELIAHHYTEAGFSELAITYWQQAGQQARTHSANLEAIAHLNKGLELIDDLPETSDRMRRELALQIALALAHHSTKGQMAADVRQAYIRAKELCEQVSDDYQLFRVLMGLYRCERPPYHDRWHYLHELDQVAKRTQDSHLIIESHMAQGTTKLHDGEFVESQAHLEKALRLYDPQNHTFYASHTSIDPGVNSLSRLSWTLWFLGYPDQSLKRSQETLALARQLGHAHSLAMVCVFAALLHQFRHEPQPIYKYTQTAHELATQHALNQFQIIAVILSGWLSVHNGQRVEGLHTYGIKDSVPVLMI